MTTIVSHICNKLDEGKAVLELFLDVKKAFDSVDHLILLAKLEKYGIRGVANNPICNFLKNCNQQVRVNGTLSDCIISNHGIPQKTVFGSLLFIIYINDLLNINCDGSIFCFADDINKNHIHKKSTHVLTIIKNGLIIIF